LPNGRQSPSSTLFKFITVLLKSVSKNWNQGGKQNALPAPDGLALFNARFAWLIEGAITYLQSHRLRGELLCAPAECRRQGILLAAHVGFFSF